MVILPQTKLKSPVCQVSIHYSQARRTNEVKNSSAGDLVFGYFTKDSFDFPLIGERLKQNKPWVRSTKNTTSQTGRRNQVKKVSVGQLLCVVWIRNWVLYYRSQEIPLTHSSENRIILLPIWRRTPPGSQSVVGISPYCQSWKFNSFWE